MAGKSWIPPIALRSKPASAIGAWDTLDYYLKVPEGLGPAVRGGTAQWDNDYLWYGSPEEVEQAIETIRRFLAQPGETLEEILTACPWYGANFRINEENELEAQQGLNLPPPPWEFQLVAAPGGGANLEFRTVEAEP